MSAKPVEVSRATIGRLPLYLDYLKRTAHTCENISATALAKALGLGEVQVRKDLGAVSGAGRPKTGYHVRALIETLETFLRVDSPCPVVIVGAGKLGRALLDYGGFQPYGLQITAAFDIAVDKTVYSQSGKPIYPMTDFDRFFAEHEVPIGIITVPADQAQRVCDRLVQSRVRGIWCFAPCTLQVPPQVSVQYENMGLSLAYLSRKMNTADL